MRCGAPDRGSQMTRPRRLATLLVFLLLVTPVAAAGSVSDRAASTDSFQGIDGLSHPSAPLVVDTTAGLFFGPDFDLACLYGADVLEPMRQMTRLARLISRSGRRVVWTGAPSKTSVLFDQLDAAGLPHGGCDSAGQRAQDRALDRYRDPAYLPIRKALAASPRQAYWRTDPHWTTVGASIWTRAVASALDPRLGRKQRYSYGTETAVGLFNSLREIDSPETVETAMPAGPVRSRTAKNSVQQWAGYPSGVSDYAWTSKPARLTWPGRTLVFGDSFSFYALPTLLPVFRHGRFMWIGTVDLDDVVAAIKDADTVVLEVYQSFLLIDSDLTSQAFRQKVRRALH